ncbi:unnamed protein product [Orchesella dallaii]|uniref:Uncharacterized protein n=1 Tax=Orchesella dallaii TaxID=48710 RepID=A0ABP1QIM0_9HEXA
MDPTLHHLKLVRDPIDETKVLKVCCRSSIQSIHRPIQYTIYGDRFAYIKMGILKGRKSIIQDKKFSTATIIVTNETIQEEVEPPSTGSFVHLKKKVKKYYYDEILKRQDPFFQANVGSLCDSYFRGQKVRFKEKKAEHFAANVDLDAYEYHKVVFHSFLNEILQSSYFRGIILFLVMLNAVMIGIATFPSVTEKPGIENLFTVVDQIILSVFIFEIVLKWMYDFRLFWKVRNFTDNLILSYIKPNHLAKT